MPGASNKENDMFDSIIELVFNGVSMLFICFFTGFYELRKKAASIIFIISALIPAGLFIAYRYFGLGEKLYVLVSVALPVLVLLILGGRRKQKQMSFEKIFMEANFKGKDGRVPLFLGLKETDGNKTQLLFKSNIPLSVWKKNKELLQTNFDFQILSIEQGKSNKIIRLEYVPADYDIGVFIPWDWKYMDEKTSVMALGVSLEGPIKADLNTTPHWLIAGATGTGKSKELRLLVIQAIAKKMELYLMDFKGGIEFGKKYEPFCKELTKNKKRAVEILKYITEEMDRRIELLYDEELDNIEEYNERHPDNKMNHILVAIDELKVFLTSGKNKEDKELTMAATDLLEYIAVLGRAPGVNLLLGIQRPDAVTISGQIRTNVSGRVCGYLPDGPSSIVVISNTDAHTILPAPKEDGTGKGRFIFQEGTEGTIFQGYLVNDTYEIKQMKERKDKNIPHPWDHGEPKAKPIDSPIRVPSTVAVSKKTKYRKNTDLVTDYSDCEEAG